MLRAVAIASGLTAALAACAPLPPPVPGPYDGTYLGAARLVGFSAPDWRCDWRAPPITVAGSRFTADLDGATMTVPIRPDGTFDAYGSRPVYRGTRYQSLVHIRGRIADGALSATVLQPRCTFRLEMARRSSAIGPG